jgi:glyoxylase-like metal-dependent hydrolase (beta-lactamase superfamily II)
MRQIKPGIYYEASYLGVTLGALAFSHGTIMIDAPLRPEDARSWRSALVNHRSGSSRVLILLDAHLDRTLGARAMECTIISHQMSAQTFRNRPTIFKGQGVDSGADWETYDDVIGTRWASPDITFTDQTVLHWGGSDVILEHHPGPMPGAIWVDIPAEKVIFIGDAVTPDQPPFLANADLLEWITSLELLFKSYNNYTLVSGRGGPITGDDLRTQLLYLKSIHRAIEKQVKRNTSPEAIENLVPSLLNEIRFPAKYTEQYTQRLRSGLVNYFNRHYGPAHIQELPNIEEAEL